MSDDPNRRLIEGDLNQKLIDAIKAVVRDSTSSAPHVSVVVLFSNVDPAKDIAVVSELPRPRPPPQQLSTVIRGVMAAVLEVTGLPLTALRGRRTLRSYSVSRELACWALRQFCGLSYPEIGRELVKDHTTTLAAVRRFQQKLDACNGAALEQVRRVREALGRG